MVGQGYRNLIVMSINPSGRPIGRQSTNRPQRRFQFIDNTNLATGASNSTQVRRHVMQEYMREKRWENRVKVEGEITGPEEQVNSPVFVNQPRKRPAHPSRSQRHAVITDSVVQPPASCVEYNKSLRSDQPNFEQHQKFSLLQSHAAVQARQDLEITDRDTDALAKIPRSGSSLPRKYSRHGFDLTPQSFAQIADYWPTPPTTPPLSLKSDESHPSISPLCNFAGAGGNYHPTPISVLSAARTDPFDCLPLTLSKRDQELFDFYANVMPACSYGFERRDPRAHNWYLSVFIPEAMKSPVAFQNTILVHAANTQAWVRGLTETPLAIEHRAKASEMLSHHFQRYPFDTSDAAISSTLSAAALEDFDPRTERREYAWLHWRAAMQKIRDRGGPIALEQNVSLRMLINWSDYIFSGYNGQGSSFYFDHDLSLKPSDSAHAELIGFQEVSQQCEEFIIFLRCTEQLALVAANLQYNTIARQNQLMRYTCFEPGQPLYSLLASPNGPRYTKTGQLKQIISRLAALMTINVAIWEYRYSMAASEAFFSELVENVLHNDLDQHISVEALLQILLSGSSNPNLRHTERPWLVGRLLKVAKRLSRSAWEKLNDFLLQCLTLGPSLSPSMHILEQELRTEILSAPLVSYILPLMQG